MNKIHKSIFVALILLLLNASAQATAIFAREYAMKCSACHVGTPPALNSMGQRFYRNGFKFSEDDMSRAATMPFSVFLGGRYREGSADLTMPAPGGKQKVMTKRVTEIEPTLKLMSASPINNNMAYFIGGKFVEIRDETDPDYDSWIVGGKKGYLQYHTDDLTHIGRGGIIAPYSQFGNIKRSSEGDGINPDLFETPLTRANTNQFITGFDYTYNTESGINLLLAAGTIIEDNEHFLDDDRLNFTVGMEYNNRDDFRIALLANHTQSINDDAYSSDLDHTVYMIPAEYSVNGKYFFNVAGVFEPENTKISQDTYSGLQASAAAVVSEDTQLRFIASFDSEDSRTFALKLSRVLYDQLFINAQYAKVDTDTPTNSKLLHAEGNTFVISAELFY